jgi:DNA-binding response OmpR family regulator
MQPLNFSRLRVLIVGAKGYAALLLRSVLNTNGIVRVCVTEDSRHALNLLCTENFDAVFLEEQVAVNGMPFAMVARRTEALKNPMIAIFVVYSGARRRDVENSRDHGANDVIARPFSPKTVIDKLSAALRAPRPFIAAPHFFGPDRRSKARIATTMHGRERRVRTPQKAKLPMVEI